MAANNINVTGSTQTGSSSVVIPALNRLGTQKTSLMPMIENAQITGTGKVQTILKRKAPASDQIVTKVFIQQPANSNQRQVIPVSSIVQQGQQIVLSSLPQMLSDSSQEHVTVMANQVMRGQPASQTSTRTITIAKAGSMSPQKVTLATPGTPTKVISLSNRLPISPIKSPTKIMIPVNKSPQKTSSIANQVIVVKSDTMTTSPAYTSTTKPTTLPMSPSKVIIQRPAVGQGISGKTSLISQISNSTGGGAKQVIIPVTGNSNIQSMQMTGSKFSYMRLVTTPSAQNQTGGSQRIMTQTKPIAPAPSAAGAGQYRIMPVNQPPHVLPKPASSQTQRLLLPATSNIAIRPNPVQTLSHGVSQTNSLTRLPPGTAIISSGQNVQGVQGFALVPAQYVEQLQHASQPDALQQHSKSKHEGNYLPSLSGTHSGPQHKQPSSTTTESSGHRPRKPCNCTKSQCLKLYCDCFANGEFCHNCNCQNCFNNLDHEEERSRAIKSCLDRNPLAFHPKIGKGKHGEDRRHNKGCNCKRSGCLKNYCECYEAKILCSNMCKCVGCKNFQESPERKTLMHLADAAEVRVQQQTAAKSKLSSQIQDLPSRPLPQSTGERLPYTFVTAEVAEATCSCLLAQAEEAERTRQMDIVQERMVMEECGRCLMQIIESANRTKGS